MLSVHHWDRILCCLFLYFFSSFFFCLCPKQLVYMYMWNGLLSPGDCEHLMFCTCWEMSHCFWEKFKLWEHLSHCVSSSVGPMTCLCLCPWLFGKKTSTQRELSRSKIKENERLWQRKRTGAGWGGSLTHSSWAFLSSGTQYLSSQTARLELFPHNNICHNDLFRVSTVKNQNKKKTKLQREDHFAKVIMFALSVRRLVIFKSWFGEIHEHPVDITVVRRANRQEVT